MEDGEPVEKELHETILETETAEEQFYRQRAELQEELNEMEGMQEPAMSGEYSLPLDQSEPGRDLPEPVDQQMMGPKPQGKSRGR